MNSRLAANLLRLSDHGHRPPVRNPGPPVAARPSMSRHPIQLQPIAWGKPDKTLARALGQHVRDATPAIVIPFNPLNHARVRRVLRSLGIHR